jgi:hypothetical protein
MTTSPATRLRHAAHGSAVLSATCLLAFAACRSPTAPPVEGVPEVLEFSTGGFGTGSRILRLHGDTVATLTVPWDYDPAMPADSSRLVPGPEAWRSFWAAVGEAGVRRWRSRYVAPDIVDGMGWSLTLKAGGFSVQSMGSNAYPDRLGRKHEGASTDEFRRLVAALDALSGGAFQAGPAQ